VQPASHENNRIIFRFMAAMVLVYALLSLFSGLPAGANLTAFVIGLILLFLGIAALMGLAWYTVIQPLPLYRHSTAAS